MPEQDVPFYTAYDYFYNMVEKNPVFSDYCTQVFGMDLSQDGFSDLEQVKGVIKAAGIKAGNTVLDMGCGNGKMLEYITDTTGAVGYGFDFSPNAIRHAIARTKSKANKLVFEVASLDDAQYASGMFDAVLSVDTLYFSKDMRGLVEKIRQWLKPGGVFVALYSEGHLGPRTDSVCSTELAMAFEQLGIHFHAINYTLQHLALMQRKRRVLESLKVAFEKKNMRWYYDAALAQSVEEDVTFSEFIRTYNRYLYKITKAKRAM